MDFNMYKIPKEFRDKFKITQRDLREFKNFRNDNWIKINKMSDLSNNDISLLHKSFMNSFGIAKASSKEKYTPTKYKHNIYINHN